MIQHVKNVLEVVQISALFATSRRVLMEPSANATHLQVCRLVDANAPIMSTKAALSLPNVQHATQIARAAAPPATVLVQPVTLLQP